MISSGENVRGVGPNPVPANQETGRDAQAQGQEQAGGDEQSQAMILQPPGSEGGWIATGRFIVSRLWDLGRIYAAPLIFGDQHQSYDACIQVRTRNITREREIELVHVLSGQATRFITTGRAASGQDLSAQGDEDEWVLGVMRFLGEFENRNVINQDGMGRILGEVDYSLETGSHADARATIQAIVDSCSNSNPRSHVARINRGSSHAFPITCNLSESVAIDVNGNTQNVPRFLVAYARLSQERQNQRLREEATAMATYISGGESPAEALPVDGDTYERSQMVGNFYWNRFEELRRQVPRNADQNNPNLQAAIQAQEKTFLMLGLGLENNAPGLIEEAIEDRVNQQTYQTAMQSLRDRMRAYIEQQQQQQQE